MKIDTNKLNVSKKHLIAIAVIVATGVVLGSAILGGKGVYFSRSRNELWEKGATSGNRLELVSIAKNCEANSLLVKVRPQGPACHTGAPNCFFRKLGDRSE